MPRVTQAHLDERRREILEAAHRCFARLGFSEARMQDVAEEAALSVGALYRYFDGKDALIEALAEWGRSQKSETMEAVASRPGVEGLSELVERMTGRLPRSGDRRDALRFDVRIWGEALGQAPLEGLVQDSFREFRELVAGYVRDEQEAGRIRADVDAAALARVLVSLLAGLELQMAFEPGLDPDGYVGEVSGLLQGLEADYRNQAEEEG